MTGKDSENGMDVSHSGSSVSSTSRLIGDGT